MSRLVYNQVWEDYAVDREALQVGANDAVLMVTSGGCNVLNTLTELPRRIVTIDSNPAQRDLLREKLSVIRYGSHRQLWSTFGVPAQRRSDSVYRQGSYARFAWVRAFVHLVCGRGAVHRFVESASLEEQRARWLGEMEPRLFGPAVRAIPSAAAGVCGMHWRQVLTTFRTGRFLLSSLCLPQLRHVMTTYPIRENYFWHEMFTGEYAGEAHSPPYLRCGWFDALRQGADRVESRVGDLEVELRSMPAATFTRVNLLDVPDFLSPARRLALFSEVRRVVAPGARVVYRSFAPSAPMPESLNGGTPDGFQFEAHASARLSAAERTASYGAVYVYRT